MKILHVINNLNRGGAETLLLKIIPVMKEKTGWDISVVILENEIYLLPMFEAKGITVHVLPLLHKRLITQLLELTRFLKKTKPDIIHTHLIYGDTRGQIAAFLAGVSSRVLTLHNMELPTTRGSGVLVRLSSLLAKKIITVSNSIQKFHIKPKVYDVGKMETIYNFPGFEISSQLAKKNVKPPLRLIQVGRLKPQKGQNILIEAIAELTRRGVDCELKIYGTGELENELNTQIDTLELTNVQLMGLTENVEEKLLESDVFISSSLWEGFNMGLVEALSVGVPVIATDLPPHREILTRNGEYPFLVSPGSSIDIVDSVIELLSKDFDELSIKAKDLAKSYSIENFMNEHIKLYSELVKEA